MNNLFINEYFDWRVRRASHVDRLVNIVARRVGLPIVHTADTVDRMAAKIVGHLPRFTRSGISTSIEQRINLFHLLSQTVAYDVPGDVVELGCNTGQSAVLFQTVLSRMGSDKQLHLYDSFEGLPTPEDIDGATYAAGELGTSEDVVLGNFARFGLPAPHIHRGWFDETLPDALPATIGFAHLDGDLYSSIATSLRHVYPRLSAGAVCVVDDYCDPTVDPDGWNELPGVKQACDEFLADKPERMSVLYAGPYSHAFLRKLG